VERRRFTALAAISALGAYAVLWLGYRFQWGGLHWVDVDAVKPMHAYALSHPGWVRLWEVVGTVFGPNGFRVAGLIALAWVAARRRFREALFVFVTIGLSGLVDEIAKRLAGRPRPTDALVHASSSAFPSGHAVAAMVAVLALLTVTADVLGRAERLAVALGVVVVIAVGYSRVALAVHYPSDVVAGWALGYLWFVMCLWAIRAPAGREPRPSATAVPPR
jgi:membrane-associated phospholipid phosphatase